MTEEQIADLQAQVTTLQAENAQLREWQGLFAELYSVIDGKASFDKGFDWFAEARGLVMKAHEIGLTDHRQECEQAQNEIASLKAQLSEHDDSVAAELELIAAGIDKRLIARVKNTK